MAKEACFSIGWFWVVSFFSSCGILESDETTLLERQLCSALNVSSMQEFLDNNNTAHFDQLDHNESIFLFPPSLVTNGFDSQNIIELTFAQIDFDFEDETVDPLDRGGFWARWKMVIVPFDMALQREYELAETPEDLEDLLNLMRNQAERIEVQLFGPFLRAGCEWGDTDELGTQTLHYSNYGIYDWDLYPDVERVLGIIYEGDENVNDDFIAWLNISRTSGQVVVEEKGKYKIVFQAVSNIEIRG
ncbi:MAG: hypothetical protein GWN62_23725 [Aliifodinibius sp.]|nr:hypothetical protein [Fodinibius sp.]